MQMVNKTHVHDDAAGGKQLTGRMLAGHVAAELVVVLVPLDRVETRAAQVERAAHRHRLAQVGERRDRQLIHVQTTATCNTQRPQLITG